MLCLCFWLVWCCFFYGWEIGLGIVSGMVLWCQVRVEVFLGCVCFCFVFLQTWCCLFGCFLQLFCLVFFVWVCDCDCCGFFGLWRFCCGCFLGGCVYFVNLWCLGDGVDFCFLFFLIKISFQFFKRNVFNQEFL